MQKFHLIGFYVLLALVIVMAIYIRKTTPYLIKGGISWSDVYSNNANATADFVKKIFNMSVKTQDFQGDSMDYRLVKADGALFPTFAIMQITDEYREKGMLPHSTLYFTVKKYDDVHKAMLENGAKVLVEPQTKNDMHFGIYLIPGDVDIAIIEYKEHKDD